MRDTTKQRVIQRLCVHFTDIQVSALIDAIEDAIDSELADHIEDYEHHSQDRASSWV